MTKKNKKATKAERKSRYGYLTTEAPETPDDDIEVTSYTNTTSYGGKRWRTGYSGKSFTHPNGTKPTAVILDIDGTLQDWGSSTVSKGMEFAKKHHEAGDVLIVATARDHEWMYETSFNWLMHNLPYPFIGPFMRSVDDPRTAGEFKRELALALESIYTLVGAVDDNQYVCDMWDEFAKDRPGFDSVRLPGYTPYADWRKDLPNKEHWKNYSSGYEGYSGYTSSYNTGHPKEHWVTGHWDDAKHQWVKGHWESDDEHPGQRWVPGHWDKKASKYIDGYWEPDPDASTTTPAGNCRGCGQRYGHSINCPNKQRSFGDISDDPAWKNYLTKREAKGAYVGGGYVGLDHDEEDEAQADPREGYDLYMADLRDIVAHDYPGYSMAEITSMDESELRELAGLTSPGVADMLGELSDEDRQPLFDDTDLGDDGEFATRSERVQFRLNLEDEVYAAYPELSMPEIEDLDIEVLRQMVEEDRAKRHLHDAEIDAITDEVAAIIEAEVIEDEEVA